MKRIACLLLCLMLVTGWALAENAGTEVPEENRTETAGTDAAEETDTTELDAAFGKIFKTYKVTGCTLIVAKHGKIVYRRNYGYSHKKSKQLVDDNTYFRLASVTKFVSAIRVMQLVEQGLLDLDEDISTYLGYKVENPYKPKQPLTLRMLMTHTSSLKSSGGYSNEKNGLRYLISNDRKARGNYFDETPGSAYRYSNFGAGIMGSLVEAVTGENINDAVTEGVFAPMGIDAAYAASLLQNPDDITYLYTRSGSTYSSRNYALRKKWDASVNPDMHFRITVGSLWMRAEDLCRLAMLMCNEGTYDGVTLLQPETVRLMMSDQKGQGAVTADTPYGLCVHRETTLLKGTTVYGHQGMLNDVLCNVYFEPESEFVYVLLTNGCNNSMDNHVGKLTRKAFKLAWDTFGGVD